MKLLEVTRPSDKAAERVKLAMKEESMRKRVVNAYVRGLKAPQYNPHVRDVEFWLFGGSGLNDPDSLKELEVWADAIAFMVRVNPLGARMSWLDDQDQFRTFSHHINVPHEMVDFVCSGGSLPEEIKK